MENILHCEMGISKLGLGIAFGGIVTMTELTGWLFSEVESWMALNFQSERGESQVIDARVVRQVDLQM